MKNREKNGELRGYNIGVEINIHDHIYDGEN
jgi:hypothetical protein